MKITAVLGSPSKDGNTGVLAREVLKGAKDSGADIEEIFLAEHKIEFCRGCISKDIDNMCMSTGECVINDDVNFLREKLYQSDGIVLASPSYGLSETARMKNFLIDRIGMFTVYTSRFAGKYFAGVSTCGAMGAKKVAKSLAEHYVTGFHGRGYMSGYLGVKIAYDRIENNQEALKNAYKLGEKLADDIKKKRKYPFQKLFDRLLTILVVRKVITNNIYENKNGRMKSVYEDLVSREIIQV
ncbi:MAG: flavodoxin family protein [Halanaerobiales bacterium]